MKIEPYRKNPEKYTGAVYPTVEEFCNSYYGEEPIIAHEEEFTTVEGKLDTTTEIAFTHRSDYRACFYLPKKWWMADVLCWRIFEDGIHIMIQEYKEDTDDHTNSGK